MNVSAYRSNLWRQCAVWGVRLTITAPLLLAPIAPLLLTAQPLKAETTPMGDHDDRTHDHHEMHDAEMHDMPNHSGDDHGENHGDDHGENHGDDHGDDHGENHGHSSIEVDASQPIPNVAIAIHPDSASGWNLEIITSNFELTGATAGQANSSDQGHAHLYANGVKIARVYGNWYHIPTLPSGEVELELVLNSNQHQTLTHNGLPIAASTTITTD
ncbi:MAG: hypothetical protein EAZ61_08795 [Oscillatoriales cyanobacterium]|nr:MAG: hypothetical protein EAZ61_08795 [Oscillatoriales cyanobacterium]